MYQLMTDHNYVRNLDGGAVVRVDADGYSAQAYRDWLSGGGVPDPAPAPTPFVPPIVTRFQACAALLGAGLLDSVEAAMSDPATPRLALLAWTTAQEFRRNSPLVTQLGESLGLDDAALDSLFIAAGSIEA